MRRLLWIPVLIVGMLVGWWSNTNQQPASAQIDVTRALLVAQSVTGATTVSNWQMTGITSSTAVAVTVPAGTRAIEIQAEDTNLRWRSDGTSPTSSVGNIIYAGDGREFGASLANIELIATSGTAKANLHGTR